MSLVLDRPLLTTLVEYPGNPRRGNVEAIRASLRANGQFQPLVVQVSTRQVLSGNHTLQAMRAEGFAHADVYFVDVDDETARRIVLAANRTADLGTYDNDDLAALLQAFESPDGLEGTGYDADDLAALLNPPSTTQTVTFEVGANEPEQIECPHCHQMLTPPRPMRKARQRRKEPIT